MTDMKKEILSLAIVVLLLAGVSLVSCETKETPDGVITTTAVVKYFPPPDNCDDYMIEVEGKIYKPENLSEKYKVDDCKVKIKYRLTEGKHSCGFGGYVPIINILKIEKV
jgi:hypothetical protein